MRKSTFTNFRDLGGLEAQNNKKIKHGKLFRASKIHGLTRREKKMLDSLELDSIIDFRTPVEIFEAKNYIPKGVKYIKSPCFGFLKYPFISACLLGKILAISPFINSAYYIIKNKKDSYLDFMDNKAYDKLFELLDAGETIIFHCTEGKDRTGIAAAIIEMALGRTKEQALEEYLLSNEYRPNKNRENLKYLGLSKKRIDSIAFAESVHEELFNITFDAALEKYGTIDNYLEKVFNITKERREKWQEFYLE